MSGGWPAALALDSRRALRGAPAIARPRTVANLRRAVIELAIVRGWHLPQAADQSVAPPLPGLVFGPPMMAGLEIGWPDLTLIRRLDRRLVFAALTSEGARAPGPRRRLVLDLLSALRWSSDERRRAEVALGYPVPSIETFVWRPSDLMAGTIDEVLR